MPEWWCKDDAFCRRDHGPGHYCATFQPDSPFNRRCEKVPERKCVDDYDCWKLSLGSACKMKQYRFEKPLHISSPVNLCSAMLLPPRHNTVCVTDTSCIERNGPGYYCHHFLPKNPYGSRCEKLLADECITAVDCGELRKGGCQGYSEGLPGYCAF
ncbi:unnamed protein product, partial [Mesorhabditis spiculigera]